MILWDIIRIPNSYHGMWITTGDKIARAGSAITTLASLSLFVYEIYPYVEGSIIADPPIRIILELILTILSMYQTVWFCYFINYGVNMSKSELEDMNDYNMRCNDEYEDENEIEE